MMLFYFLSSRVIRSVPYGVESRNALDIYLPRKKWRRMGPCPVIIYVTGGMACRRGPRPTRARTS